MTEYHIAQINIARAKDAMDSSIMKGFADRLDDINALADSSLGFVWRLQSDDGDATSIQVFDDPMLIVNMSVWESFDFLSEYVYKSVHVELIRERAAWFQKLTQTHQALWNVPAGYIPSVEEGKSRLHYLQKHGPSEHAFTFAKPYFQRQI